MFLSLKLLWDYFRNWFIARNNLAQEIFALRHQLSVYKRAIKRPVIKRRDRIIWSLLSRFFQDWKSALVIVKPETVVRWHRAGFKLFWRFISAPKGRPAKEREIRELIKKMSGENPLWGTPRIQSELKLLGFKVARSTIARYMVKGQRKPPSQTWRNFIKNHFGEICACDFFTVPTATFRGLYVFFVISLSRRKILHFNISEHPTSAWTAIQIRQAFYDADAPKFLIRDRAANYGHEFKKTVKALGIEEVVTSYRSPWQNGFAERVVGSIRRECLDHMIIFSEDHLHKILKKYFEYYHDSRTHLSLGGNAPNPREVEPPTKGKVKSIRVLGGLHHRYKRVG